MGKTEIRNICPVSLTKPAAEQPQLHNRWHPDVPFAGSIKDGETVKIECVDWTGGQIGRSLICAHLCKLPSELALLASAVTSLEVLNLYPIWNSYMWNDC